MRRTRQPINRDWPSWRYGPDGESAIFDREEDVPFGWSKKPGEKDEEEPFICPPSVFLDRDELVAKLAEMNVEINHTWGNGHMKRIIDGDISPTG